ncbi:hypothetical protein FHS55_004371 [Angulomicrobium tetraedrale]|uniref:Uncharacterized protein n=1 Tax=Ancylobacter tetraedralis TaxID=217068 RepID=A0A839ZGK7_9HYPH|nr:DUF6527 family protein [Ancylobacter tetraedralis]MBB3773727.1 hypothetical protein [Ancylobacter tetraedralis]
MTGASHLRPEFVEFIPGRLEPGVLYISRRYATASHLCCCGCEREVVTPLNPAKWRITERAGKVSLAPSVGNWSFPCRSHYWINGNRIQWATAMAPEVIQAVQARDRRDAELCVPKQRGWISRVVDKMRGASSLLLSKLKSWWR